MKPWLSHFSFLLLRRNVIHTLPGFCPLDGETAYTVAFVDTDVVEKFRFRGRVISTGSGRRKRNFLPQIGCLNADGPRQSDEFLVIGNEHLEDRSGALFLSPGTAAHVHYAPVFQNDFVTDP